MREGKKKRGYVETVQIVKMLKKVRSNGVTVRNGLRMRSCQPRGMVIKRSVICCGSSTTYSVTCVRGHGL